MNELIFQIEEADDGGYTAHALGHSIFTEAESLDELRDNVRDAVRCHFDAGDPVENRLAGTCMQPLAVEQAPPSAYAFCMVANIEKLTEQALALPRDARALLADRLAESLGRVPDEQVQAQWMATATRRRDEIRSGAVKPVSRDEARERIHRTLS